MHIIGIRKFCCIYQIVRDVYFFQLKKSYNPFKGRAFCSIAAEAAGLLTQSQKKYTYMYRPQDFVRFQNLLTRVCGQSQVKPALKNQIWESFLL